MYVDDLVEAMLVVLERGEPGTAYTAWEGTPVGFAEYFARLAQIAGGGPPRRLPRPVLELGAAAMEAWARLRGTAPAFSPRAITFVERRGTVATNRIRKLGWEPRVPLEEGMRRVEAWLRAEGLA
jgi:nucleoside-diphosphate-sugar epimerase